MQRKQSIDPTVANLLGDMNRDTERRRLPAKEKKRQAKEREKMAARNRMTLDIPPEIEQRLTELANQYHVPVSQLFTYLVYAGLHLLDEGSIDPLWCFVPTNSPRYSYNLEYKRFDDFINFVSKGRPLEISRDAP